MENTTRLIAWDAKGMIVDVIECRADQVAEMRAHMESLAARGVYGGPVVIREYAIEVR
jgi:hypothetical protein